MLKCEKCGKEICAADAHFLTYVNGNELGKTGDVVLCDDCNDLFKNRGIADTKRFTAKEVLELAKKIYNSHDLSDNARLELTDNDQDYVDCQATHDIRRMLIQFARDIEVIEGLRMACENAKKVLDAVGPETLKGDTVLSTGVIGAMRMIDRKLAFADGEDPE